MIRLWDYQPGTGKNEIRAWAQALSVRERAQLNQKLDMVTCVNLETARSLRFLVGVSGDHHNLYRLIVHSDHMLSPILCWGPIEPQTEITLLCGAVEKDFDLEPVSAVERAEAYRTAILSTKGRNRICHERF